MKQSILGLFYEDFVEGEEIRHALSKTIFESDNNLFSLLTMNHHPVHTNIDYASHNQHGQLAPTFIGDTLYARTRIISKRESHSKPDRGIVCVETIGYNQRGVDVISFRRNVLVKKKEEKC